MKRRNYNQHFRNTEGLKRLGTNNYTNKMPNLEERNKFLDIYNFPRVNQEEIDNMNRPITSNEIESIRRRKKKKKNLPANKSPGSDVYIGRFCKHLAKT